MESDPYAHLITSDWDERFLTTPSFRTWFEHQVQVTPMEEGELLVDYVRVQIESARVAGEPSVMENGADAGEDSLALFDMESYSADAPAFENYAENGGSMAYSSLYSPSNESATQQAYFAQQSAIAAHQQQSGTIAPQSIDPTVVVPAASSRGGSRPTPYVEISVASGTTAAVRPTPSSSRSAPPVASTPAPAAKKLAPAAASRSVKKPSPAPVASTSTLPHADPWEKAIPVIRESLTVVRLTRAVTSTSTKLAGILSAYTTDKDTKWGDKSMVPLSGRIEVLQLLGSAKEEFWKAWLEKGAEGGMETMMIWFIGASDKSKTPNSAERQILVLLLNIFAKLPVTMDQLLKYGVGPRVKTLSGQAADPIMAEVGKLAKSLMDKWKKLVDATRQGAAAAAPKTVADGKRKADVPNGASKKAKTTPSAPIAAVSAPKVVLPSFKKEKRPDGPKVENAFLQTLQSLTGPPRVPSKDGLLTSLAPKGVKKVKKSVRWPEDDKLVMIRIIEKAVYDGDVERDEEGDHSLGAVRVMEEQEGLTLNMHLEEEMEEEIEWYSPIYVELSEQINVSSSDPSFVTSESHHQATRETSTPAYIEPLHLEDAPPSPSEPTSPAFEPTYYDPKDLHLTPISMLLPANLRDDPEIQSLIASAQSSIAPTASFAASDTISSLLSQLVTTGYTGPGSSATYGSDSAVRGLQGFDPNLIRSIIDGNPALQQLGAQLGNQLGGGSGPPSSSYQDNYGQRIFPNSSWTPSASSSGWDNPSSAPLSAWDMQSGSSHPPPPPSNNGRRKEKSGYKGSRTKKPEICKFFGTQKGCDWGDKCFNIHERR